jgi:hypothetical protein
MTSLLVLSLAAHAAQPALPAAQATALVQSWVTVYDQDSRAVADPSGYGDPEDDAGFKMRRVRMGLEGADSTLRYGVTMGVGSAFDGVEAAQQDGSTSVQLVDAYGGWSPREGLWLVGGQQKVPVSREQLMASGDLTFTQRSVATYWLSPGRDMGAVVDLTKSIARLRIGAFNGGGDFTGDTDEGKLYSARAEVVIGDADAYQTFGAVEGYTLGVGVDGYANSTRAVGENGAGADLLFRMRGLAFLAEARFVQVAPSETLSVVPGVLTETERQGATIQAGYTLGAFEPALRYAILDDNVNIDDTGDVAELQGGVTYHSSDDRLRAGLGYVMRTETGSNPVDNDTVRAWLQLKL